MEIRLGPWATRRRLATTALVVSLWLLLGPPDRGDEPIWIIRGGYESRDACETFRERNPNPHWLLCANVGRSALEPSAPPFRQVGAAAVRSRSIGRFEPHHVTPP